MSDDVIEIRDLRVNARLGVQEGERRSPQEVLISLALHCDLRRAGHSDRLLETLDYRRVAQGIALLAERGAFNLIERLAETVAAHCILELGVGRIVVRVVKPSALPAARSVGVRIERNAAEYVDSPPGA